MVKGFIVMAAACIAASVAFGEIAGGTEGELKWGISEDGTLTVSGQGAMPSYIRYVGGADIDMPANNTRNIPSHTRTYAPWYSYKSDINKVIIENGVTSVGWNAFRDLIKLKSAVISNSVVYIDTESFRDCFNLTSVIIPNSVYSIGNKAFMGCSSLSSITIPNSVTSIGYSAFSYCGGLTSAVIPNSVKVIADSAFSECSGLTSIVIPNSIDVIRSSVFANCTGLTDIIIPNSVKNIDSDAFDGCKGLKQIVIPNSVIQIGNGVFANCTGLTDIIIPNSVISIGIGAFANCTGLTDVIIPDSVNIINSSAFYECKGLRQITSLAAIPPAINEDYGALFYGVSTSSVKLYVPAQSLNAYKTAAVWKDFYIEAMPFMLNSAGVTLTNAGTTQTLKPIFDAGFVGAQNIIWTSGNPSIAAVSSAGTITAKSAGTAIIKATVVPASGESGGKSAGRASLFSTDENGGFSNYCVVSVLGETTDATPIKAAAPKKSVSVISFAGIKNGEINLNFKAGNYTAELYNLQGRLVGSVNIDAKNGLNATGIKTDNLSKGIFILNVKQTGISVLKQKIKI